MLMGAMMILMVIGFLGFGHHYMMGGHGKGEQKQEIIEHNHDKEMPCPDCLEESKPGKRGEPLME